jgi:hypothetical protein
VVGDTASGARLRGSHGLTDVIVAAAVCYFVQSRRPAYVLFFLFFSPQSRGRPLSFIATYIDI